MEIFHRHMHFDVNLSVLLTSLILDQELSFCSCKIQLVPSRYDIYSAKGIRFTDGADANSLWPHETKKE